MRSTAHDNEFTASLKSARRTLVLLLAGMVLMLLLPSASIAQINAYLPLHMALETGAIIAAAMIFVMGWHTISIRPNYRLLVMACCFLGVALLDFAHMIFFEGMPRVVDLGSPDIGINFWLAGRVMALAAMTAYVVLPRTFPDAPRRWLMVSSVLLAVVLINIWFLFFPQYVPTTYDSETGLTWFKVITELVLATAFAACAFVLWQRSQSQGHKEVLDLALACAVMACSEIFFAIYRSLDDVYALAGHLYKIVAYWLLYRGIVVKGVKQPYREIETLNQRINATLDALPDMLFELSPDGVIHNYHSRIHRQDLMMPPEQFLGQPVASFLPENAIGIVRDAFADIDATGITNGRQYYIGEGQQQRWYELSGASRATLEGEKRYIMIVRDVTDRVRADRELRIAATAFSTQEGIMITDAETHILRVNSSFEKTTGYSQDEVIGKRPSYFSSGRHDAAFYKKMWESIQRDGFWRGEIWNRRKSGEIYPQALTITAVRNPEGGISNYVGDFIDISDIKAAEQKISRLSYFDVLTGLPNRERLMQTLAEVIQQSHKNMNYGALLVVDLDAFKNVNETLGYPAGDTLLTMVADRLSALADQRNSVARYGGDEYVMVLADLGADATGAADLAGQKAQSVLAALEDEYDLHGARYYTTGCVGVALISPESDDEPDVVLKKAGIALTEAKASGRNRMMFFDPALQDAISEKAKLLSEMREAIRLHQFELYVQPQQSADKGIIGVEALVRWNHPERGLLSPNIFIPLAEANDMAAQLGREILELGLDILQRWRGNPLCQNLKVSVNLAAEQFYEPDFCSRLMQGIKSRNLDPGLLMLEFTESTLMGNMAQARQIMQKISDAGGRFAIDDFGTGYSSLSYLSELALHQLKIDQSFVRKMQVRKNNQQIVKAIIDLASSLGMDVIAEGVETEEQREQLYQMGCKLYQGYLISKPVPVVEFEKWLQQQN